MGSGGSCGRRVWLLVGAGCALVAVAAFAIASGSFGGDHHRIASIRQGTATTAVTTDPGPAAAVAPDDPGADLQGTASAPVTGTNPAVTAPPTTVAPLPTEVERMLSELGTQLKQAGGGDGGAPETVSREEVDALVTAQLRALGIEL